MPETSSAVPEGRPSHRLWLPLRSLIRQPAVLLSAVLLVVFVVVGLLAPWITPHDPHRQNLRGALQPPSMERSVARDGTLGRPHYMGTDKVGRDVLSRVIYGARISLVVGGLAVVLAAAIGTLLGLLAGYFRGNIDSLVMLLSEVQLAFPTILLAIVIIAALGPGLTNTMIVLVVTSWPQYARIIRAETLSVREREYVQAAVAAGAAHRRTLWRHVFPQVTPALLVLATFDIGRMIILEGSLSFLGLGVQPPMVSWGNLIADGRELIWTAWWLALFPGLALSLVILATNLFGDWLRDLLDPRLRT